MNGYVEWKDVAPKKQSNSDFGDRPEFLWLKSGNTYRVRPVHLPVHFYKYFNRKDGNMRIAICEDPDSCPVKIAHPELRATERYAIYVIDRADSKLKIMEGPRTVFLPIKKWWEMTQKNPGGTEGSDWGIEVTGSGIKTEYSATPIDAAPFTDAEKDLINAEFKDNKRKLAEIFKFHTPEVIEKKLFGDWEKSPAQPVTTAAAPAVAAPAPVVAQVPAATGPTDEFNMDW